MVRVYDGTGVSFIVRGVVEFVVLNLSQFVIAELHPQHINSAGRDYWGVKGHANLEVGLTIWPHHRTVIAVDPVPEHSVICCLVRDPLGRLCLESH